MRLQDVAAALSDIEYLLDDKKRDHAKTEQKQSEANAFRQQAQCVLENAAGHRVWFPRKELLNENAIREVANLAHRGVLSELLDLALAANAIDPAVSGAGQFARRYGFRDKPLRVRFRLLDPRRGLLPTATDQDLTVTHDTFAQLNPNVARVFITENEINFLAFPQMSDSLVLFGAGYGFDMLALAAWLQTRSIHYWGDIDTHGFAILDQLRAHFGHAQSFLMDRATLLAHRAQWGKEPQPPTARPDPPWSPGTRPLC